MLGPPAHPFFGDVEVILPDPSSDRVVPTTGKYPFSLEATSPVLLTALTPPRGNAPRNSDGFAPALLIGRGPAAPPDPRFLPPYFVTLFPCYQLRSLAGFPVGTAPRLPSGCPFPICWRWLSHLRPRLPSNLVIPLPSTNFFLIVPLIISGAL